MLSGHAECAVTLLEHGATIADNCMGGNSWTLVQYVAHHQPKDIVRLLQIIQSLKEQRLSASSRSVHNGQLNSTESLFTILLGDSEFLGDGLQGSENTKCQLDAGRLRLTHYHCAVGEGEDDSPYLCLDNHESCSHDHHSRERTGY